MSPRARYSATARHHVEWLQLVDVSGPFLSLSVLVDTFPQGLDADDPEVAARLRQAYSEWQANEELRRPDLAIHREFIRLVLREVLEYEDLLAEDAEIADLKATLPEHRVTLRPDLAVRRSGEPPALLVATYKAGISLERALDERGFHASPAERMRLLLRGTDVRSGLVTNGEEWMLVHVPAERTSTFVTWQAQLLLEERVTLRAFSSLLGVRRLFGVQEPETLDGLFERSSDDEREVTDQLGRQVRRAVELLVSAFDRADREAGGRLLRELPEYRLYEAVVAVAMRIIFLLAAEARGLLPDEGPWVASYGVTPLRAELQEVADQGGEELLDRRFDAWPRLLATFRAVHGGVEHSRIRLPGYGGGLFDPGRYRFLESVDGRPLRISNRVMLHVLDAIQTLEVDVPGGRERRPLSFRALGVEQIGHVYEGLLDHTAIRADAPALGLVGTTKKEPELALAELERKRDDGEEALLDLLKEETGRGLAALRKALVAEPDPARVGRLRVACEGGPDLIARITPFLGLVRDDPYGMPMVFREGAVYVTTSPGRRATGTHYTPPSLTEPIVRYALEPIVYTGPAEGLDPEQWTLKPSRELLELKVCDIALGSAAFLVAACRYLAARLVEAWELQPDEMPQDAGADPEERELTARRLVAERCLYGVDKNPLAVEIAKVSMWLTTMRKDRPFTFLDHALRHGDSLLGITSVDQLERLGLKPEEADSVLLEPAREAIRATLSEVRAVRQRIEATDAVDVREVEAKAASLALAEERTSALRTVGDLIVGAALEVAAGKARAAMTVEASADEICTALLATADPERPLLIARIEARAGDALMTARVSGDADPPKPFHWVLEFPEVFHRERSGFDAIVGNPPFLAGKRISTRFGDAYARVKRRTLSPHRKGAADLGAYFLLRSSHLCNSQGYVALIESNSISQGATREIGLAQLEEAGWFIVAANRDVAWPGEAGVTISPVVLGRGWRGMVQLNGRSVAFISSYLDSQRAFDPYALSENEGIASTGTGLNGEGFIVSPEACEAFLLEDLRNTDVLQRYLTGFDLNNSPTQEPARYVINFGSMSRAEAERYVAPFRHVTATVAPHRATLTKQIHEERYWCHWDRREDFYEKIRVLPRAIATGGVSKHHVFSFVEPDWLYATALIVFADASAQMYGVLQSSWHEIWVARFKTTMRLDTHYSVSRCFLTFPRPVSVSERVRDVADEYHELCSRFTRLEQVGLTGIYNRFHDPDSRDEGTRRLRGLRTILDRAVADAYGWTDLEFEHDFRETPVGVRYTLSEAVKVDVLDRLLELNHERYADEVRRGLHKRGKPKRKRRQATAANPGGARLFGDG
jgi:hypothetical protein